VKVSCGAWSKSNFSGHGANLGFGTKISFKIVT